ncbi:MAG: hypothetical protein HDT38_00135 [Clostridiales bacterium]|nr:hypothetical protein [Clostridiales bacterium]
MRIFRRIIGGFYLLVALGSVYGAVVSDPLGAGVCWAIGVLHLMLGLWLILRKGKSPEERQERKQQKQKAKERNSRMLEVEHMAGLPLAQSAACTVSFEEGCITIYSSGNRFNLNYDKITAMDLKTSTEIQKTYVSSAGGAIVGGALFGPLGAMVGGRVKEKRSTTVENFIIFTYLKDGNIDYLSFKVQAAYKAMKLIQQYKPRIAQQGIVTEL